MNKEMEQYTGTKTVNIIGAHFGMQYGFLSMAVELIICGLLIIKFADKTEDKL